MYLWIDPWIRKLWYGLIDEHNRVVDAGILLLDQKSPQRTDQFKRMQEIYTFFEQMLNAHRIRAVGVEKLYFTKYNQSNAEFVYGVRGALSMLFVDSGIALYEYTPAELKKRITGNGQASKTLMVNVVTKLFALEQRLTYHDAADALGLARIVKQIEERSALAVR